jgi:hypothetical protein
MFDAHEAHSHVLPDQHRGNDAGDMMEVDDPIMAWLLFPGTGAAAGSCRFTVSEPLGLRGPYYWGPHRRSCAFQPKLAVRP